MSDMRSILDVQVMGRALFCTLFFSIIALVYSQCPANYYGFYCTNVPTGTDAAGFGPCFSYSPGQGYEKHSYSSGLLHGRWCMFDMLRSLFS